MGGHIYLWLIHADVWQEPLQYCKVVILQLKIKQSLRCDYIEQWTSLVAQMVKRLPTMRETWVQSLGREDLLEKGIATHSSILASPHNPKKGLKGIFGLPLWLRG